VIEILAGTLIDPHEVAIADRFSDEAYRNDLRRVENFSTSQSRHDALLRMTNTRKYRITVCRYVERNPLRAGLVDHSEDWQYGSLFRWNQLCEPTPQVLSAWPVPGLPNWIARVNDPLSEKELAAMRRFSLRGSYFGSTE